VDSIWVSEVFGPLPIHARVAIYRLEAQIHNVTCSVLSNEVVVIVQAILDHTRWNHSIVLPIRRQLLPTPTHINDESILVTRTYITRELIVRVHTEVGIIVVNIPAHDAIRKVLGANFAMRSALADMMEITRRKEPMLVADNVIANDIVCHPHHVNTNAFARLCSLNFAIRAIWTATARGWVPIWAYDGIITDGVVHLVPIFNIDTHTPVHPKYVGVYKSSVSAMDGDG